MAEADIGLFEFHCVAFRGRVKASLDVDYDASVLGWSRDKFEEYGRLRGICSETLALCGIERGRDVERLKSRAVYRSVEIIRAYAFDVAADAERYFTLTVEKQKTRSPWLVKRHALARVENCNVFAVVGIGRVAAEDNGAFGDIHGIAVDFSI